jgi:hypothetical protein
LLLYFSKLSSQVFLDLLLVLILADYFGPLLELVVLLVDLLEEGLVFSYQGLYLGLLLVQSEFRGQSFLESVLDLLLHGQFLVLKGIN